MPNRQLSKIELETLANPFLAEVRQRLAELSQSDLELHWALRRKIAKELVYDERGKTGHRRKLKAMKKEQQQGRCAICSENLPLKGAVLDRIEAMQGYTEANTRVVCPTCDTKTQRERGFR